MRKNGQKIGQIMRKEEKKDQQKVTLTCDRKKQQQN